MASRYFGKNLGDVKVTESGSTTSKDIELVVNLASTTKSGDVRDQAIDILNYVVGGKSTSII